MRIVISAPTGYNAREILLPLQDRLSADTSIAEVHVITPAAAYREQLFPTFNDKFQFHTNPSDVAQHVALLKNIKPSVIVTPTVGLDTKDTPIIRAGQEIGIPTVTFIASWDNVFKMERLAESTDWAMPDYLAVWNTMNRDHILKRFGTAISPERITITGPPRFDYFFNSERIPSREKLLVYIGFTEASATQPLLHCATTELYPFTYIVKELRRAITNHDLPVDTLLYASVHPGGDIGRHNHLEKFGARVKYSFGRRTNSPLPDFAYLPTTEEAYYLVALFKYAAVLINQSSTVAIESFAADVPVVNVAYGQPWDWFRWPRHGRGWRHSAVYRDFQQHYQYITKEGATSVVGNPRELTTATAAYLATPSRHRPERQATLKKMISYTDGNNSQRLIDWLKQCAA